MDFGLKDKVAIVTGAGSPIGFGKAIAVTLAKEGGDVVVNDIDEEGIKKTADEISSLGRKAIPVRADVSKMAEVSSMVKQVIDKFGRIDILVNNAGIGIAGKPFLEMTEDEWNKLISINFVGVLNCTKAVLPYMVKNKYGKIINISSDAGKTGVPKASIYAATKGAVVVFTKSIAAEMAPFGININGICPGSAKTNLGKNATPEFAELALKIFSPIGRLTDVQDIANMVAFLASDLSSDVVGQNISVDGGFVMY